MKIKKFIIISSIIISFGFMITWLYCFLATYFLHNSYIFTADTNYYGEFWIEVILMLYSTFGMLFFVIPLLKKI